MRNNPLVERFADAYHIKISQLGIYETIAAYWLEYSEALIAKVYQDQIDKLNENPLSGIIWRMIWRSSHHAGSSVVLSALGQPASGEVLARTVLESAVNSLYVLHGNMQERLNAYFANYIAGERKEIERWNDALRRLDDPKEVSGHKVAIEKKGIALGNYERAITQAMANLGAVYNPNANWAKISDRFIAINHEVSYRTVYAALCSQTHGDAEDFFNQLIVFSTGDPKLASMLELETDNFSRMLIYEAICFQLEAVGTFAFVHGLTEIADEMIKGYAEMSNIAQHFGEEATKARPK